MGLSAKRFATALLAGAVMVSGAWAGASLVPVDESEEPTANRVASTAAEPEPEPSATPASEPPATSAAVPPPPPDPASLKPGEVLAGAAKTSIRPRPEDYGGTWEQSEEKCSTMSESTLTRLFEEPAEVGDHLASTGSPWPENPNCIYMGGFSIGPMNPVTSWNDEYGLWVRAVALRDQAGDDLVLVVIDGEGYFWDYAKKDCGGVECGSKQIAERLEADQTLGLKKENIVIAATHAHSAPDFIGGWGFVPDWYMKQVSDSIESTVREALAAMRPARLEVGEHEARPFNSERRDTYRSAEEEQLGWLRAYETHKKTVNTIATVGSYAAHPTTFGTNGGQAHPDWPGLFEASLEKRFGGVGLHFMTGLGNISASGLRQIDDPNHATGADDLAALVGDIGEGDLIENPDIRTAQDKWEQPATNVPLTALGSPGFFDREFVRSPSSVQPGEEGSTFACVSSSPISVEVAASAARIGNEFALTAAPGEIFSNFSNTIKEQSRAAVTMPLGQANDALGYMPQSFELNQAGQQGLGFVAGGFVVVNYEDAYAIDKCFGDMALETSIGLLSGL